MSRVGNNPIKIPNGVEINLEKGHIKISGPKGNLEMDVHPLIKVEVSENMLLVKRSKDDKNSKSLHGLTRALLNNMVLGVSEGFNKGLELVGVGYRAAGGGNTLTLSVGYSHPVQIDAPEGVTFTVADNTKLTVSGIDKHLVGQVAANIRKIRPPEVYKGKGIRYSGEYVRRKAGKAGKAVTGAK
ncbi:MAG: 50S ribosomal protein L6 [uncultured bacterium]|uniref:Large ribosomal subunit protein uL6 n=4 Tax=Candidatus Daviesiibacteriota TaxID=1752718 RepID=A0A0G0EU32_9BACT|nr:MAG: 50S ribosomal protein L6 [uncultured bacterium]KKQ10413.1 MAG: 50S ribosomal protein L6 [Candidatus Daviesbacteria bacterium GW2011_GWB1_36_5]KKQ15793.1 MAG: 50S ribosomal protein L6 [Candidatus Daviesbacteria bacterium GW2011_GWA1_36_8]OGE16573.1 MAG: 50S ribosomal protein L6 [Candidatus Daviesbacteria bacterium RIFCSPHIGHO2_01_FULL_36_37]OGE31746.1 MAG: 50S ribosomal protein L6 [Candidatus Daviesbacteria bacterium RIFCSPHIGHO2_02_FULL_37_9]OGE34656.1 MAG: 50S ribosomal protein L6 [Ca